MVDDPARPGKKAASFWEPAKRLLNDPSKFLDSLINFDKENIKEATIQRIEPYIAMEEFTTEAVARVRGRQRRAHHSAVCSLQRLRQQAGRAGLEPLAYIMHIALLEAAARLILQPRPSCCLLLLPVGKGRAEQRGSCFHSKVLVALQGGHWPSSLSNTAWQFPLHGPLLPLQPYWLLQRSSQITALLHCRSPRRAPASACGCGPCTCTILWRLVWRPSGQLWQLHRSHWTTQWRSLQMPRPNCR